MSHDRRPSRHPENRSLIPSLVTGQLERALNRALSYAPATRMRLKRLAGKSLGLDLRNPSVQLTLLMEKKGVRTLSHLEEAPDAVIAGPFFTVMRNMARETSTGQWLASGVELQGDTELIQQVSVILAEQDFDVEEPLSELIGDVAAHQLTRATRGAFGFLKKAGRTLLEESGNFLQSDGKALVSREDADDFYDDIDRLRADYDRLEARWQRLEKKIRDRQTTADT